MAIDPHLEDTRTRVDQHEKHDAWGPVDEPDQLVVNGLHVTVDFDIWNAGGGCLVDCPVDAIDVDPGEQAVFDILRSDYR